MLDLIRILEKTVSTSQADQNEAAKFIQDYISRDFGGFMKALSDVLYDVNNPPVARSAAGLQLKNQLIARDETLRLQQQDRWRSLHEFTRSHIRDRVYDSLGTEVSRPASAPQCVAYIGIIELPVGLHTSACLIQALGLNIKHDELATPQARVGALEAIGYICQDIDQLGLSPEKLSEILDVIVDGMKNPMDECRVAATAALLNFSAHKVHKISKTHSNITFDKLGELLSVEPEYAEKIVAQMMREERIKGHLDQIERVVHFETKDVLQVFDEEILKLCSDVNDVVEKIRHIVPDEWWAANAHQSC